ncbi:MAG: VWA domain-containing protein [Candidatus Taylorbacteria bacterium]|nr:VWA domain-containing protein [Candidatus Taylorbacteria bacterium]
MSEILTDFRNNFSFLEPVFLYLLIPWAILFIFWLVTVFVKRRSRPAETYGSKYPLIGKVKLWGLFVIPAGALMVLALAKPYLAKDNVSFTRGDVEIVLVVDRSLSMRGDDIRESRLEIAKREALNIEAFLNESDKIALFVFGRESHRKIYLTRKHNTVFERVARISFPKPGNLKGDGLIWDSDFASMLENIYQSLDRQDMGVKKVSIARYVPQKKSNRIVILMSDGEDQFKRDKPTTIEDIQYKAKYLKRFDRALSEFRRRGIGIYPVGIGTAKGVQRPSLLRGYKEKEDYPVGLLKSFDWRGQVSRLDKDNLSFLARSLGVELTGHIWTVENSSTTVRRYLRSVIDSNRRVLPEFGASDDERQLWQYFLLTAVGILAFGILSYPVSGYFRRNKGVLHR